MSQPGVIDGFQFARDRSVREGRLGLDRLGRLAEMKCSTSGLRYRLEGGIDAEGRFCLILGVSGSVSLICQRCLDRLDFPVEIDARLELAREPREIVQAEDDIDRVLAAKEMDVAALVEDEVILALPMVPKHERCAIGEDHGAAVPARETPFGALIALKRRGS
jgi:uncharacterized protein